MPQQPASLLVATNSTHHARRQARHTKHAHAVLPTTQCCPPPHSHEALARAAGQTHSTYLLIKEPG